MDLALLYSGGKDSTLAALLLDPFYDVRLVTATFGVTDDWRHARAAAAALGDRFGFQTLDLDRAVADEAVERMRADGYPRRGIQRVHEHALETAAGLDVSAVADGTRRDDHVPAVPRDRARSLEDRRGVDYLAPLAGIGSRAVDHLADAALDVERGPSEAVPKADYEGELRALLAEAGGAVDEVFPEHVQTRVRGLRDPSPGNGD